MTTPRVEQIAVAVKAVIDGVTVANGYHHTLSCHRPKRRDFADQGPVNGLVYLLQHPCKAAEGQTHGIDRWTVGFESGAVVLDDDTATDPIDTRCNLVGADLVKALLVDRNLGNLAEDLKITEASMFNNGEGNSGVLVAFEVTFRTTMGNPFAGG